MALRKVDHQRLGIVEAALVAQLNQSRPQMLLVSPLRSAVDQDQHRLVVAAAMDQEAVALEGGQEFVAHRLAP
jgi:hypothetical protein